MNMVTLIDSTGSVLTYEVSWSYVRKVFPQKIEVITVMDHVFLVDGDSLEKSLDLNIEATEVSNTPIFGPALMMSAEDYSKMKAGLN